MEKMVLLGDSHGYFMSCAFSNFELMVSSFKERNNSARRKSCIESPRKLVGSTRSGWKYRLFKDEEEGGNLNNLCFIKWQQQLNAKRHYCCLLFSASTHIIPKDFVIIFKKMNVLLN